LDLSTNTALTYLGCGHNSLTSLNVSGATALTTLGCNYNSLTQVAIDNILASLVTNGLTNGYIDLSGTGNSYPSTAGFASRDTLTGSGCNVYVNIAPESGYLLASNTGQYPPTINYSDAYIQSEYGGVVNLSSNGLQKALYAIDCLNLTNLDCNNNSLTILNVSGSNALTDLYCYGNSLTSLNVSGASALTSLGCDYNLLTSLNVSGATALTTLNCHHNQLTSLNLSTNTALTILGCQNNQLTSLNLSTNTALTDLVCDNNSLTSLNISTNTALISLNCYNNPAITTTNWDTILHTLVQNELTGGYFNIHDTNHGGPDNPPSSAGYASGSILTSRGWGVYYDNA
jgi:hypothetical protein